ncbi:MAG: choice-of-anchor D domain-containing protein [Acidobacteriia bacterium]|nr:choice-of-anchor D domain-containing protein [Terriglobia bacterium]
MRFFPLIVIALLLSSLPTARASAQQLQCKPCTHAFGKVEVGTSSSFSVRLTNTGTKSLRVTSKLKQGSEFRFGHFPLPFTLSPGQTVLLPVAFRPTATGRVTGTFTLVSTALNSPLSLPVAGTGVSGPQLTVSPSSLNFGNVTVGQSATLATTLSASIADVTIASDQLTSSEFSVVGLTLPVTILSGHSIQATLQFTPNQSGTATGKVGYFSNAVVSPAVEQLTGVGVATGSHSADLTWQESDPNVVGYNIYRGATHGGPYLQINTALDPATNYTDYTVVAGTTYYYVTTAVDSVGQQSAYSNETAAAIPSP